MTGGEAPFLATGGERVGERTMSETGEHALWSREETLGYFVAGGGTAQEFERLWALAVGRKAAEAAALASGSYASAGGAVTYLVSGRKD